MHIVEPGAGYLACGWIGKGRLAEPEDIVAARRRMLTASAGTLEGRPFSIAAGPTYEDIDPVRYLGNRSSGRMGLALAEEARRRGADVQLVLGPSGLEVLSGVDVARVRTAAEMHAAVMARARDQDVVIMAAAVADYTPAGGAQPGKVAKQEGPI